MRNCHVHLNYALRHGLNKHCKEELDRAVCKIDMLLKELCHKQNSMAGIEYGAIFDTSGRYRYSLWRAWSSYHPRIVFVLLNPSAADEQRNDPTIRRCIGFARAWEFGFVEVVNLFAYRATDYRELFKVGDPVGEENDRFLVQAVERCSAVVVGWGTRGTLLGRDRQVIQLLAGRKDVYCLGLTKDGLPRHPLYLKDDTSLVPFCTCE